MSDTKKPTTKKVAPPKKPADHPKYLDMIKVAIQSLKERNGSSRQAIIKYIKANYKVIDTCDTHVKLALKRGVIKEELHQVKGTGASGSFKVMKNTEPKKKSPKKAVAAAAANKKPATATASSKKKPAAKKKANNNTTTPKKNTKKTIKKSGSAKKGNKKPAKKATAKKPAAKKVAKKKSTTPKKKNTAKK